MSENSNPIFFHSNDDNKNWITAKFYPNKKFYDLYSEMQLRNFWLLVFVQFYRIKDEVKCKQRFDYFESNENVTLISHSFLSFQYDRYF